MAPRLKTVSIVPARFPDYGMTNASSFRWGIPPSNNPPKGAKKGASVYGNDNDTKNSVNSFLEVPWVRPTIVPPASNPQRVRKGALFIGMTLI